MTISHEPAPAGEASTYDRRWAVYTEATLELLLQRLTSVPPPPGVGILDVGCGTGALLERIGHAHRAARLTGLDASPTMLAAAERRCRVRGEGGPGTVRGAPGFVRGDSGALPFASGSYQVVVSSSSLHFWPDPAAGLAEIARVLGPGGRLLLLDWSGDSLPMRLLDYWLRIRDPQHQRVLGRAELEALMAGSGFRIREIRELRSHGLWRHLRVDAVVSEPHGDPPLI